MGIVIGNVPFVYPGDEEKDHAVLLLHGLGGGAFEHVLLGRHLNQHGFTVEAINYPGHDRPHWRMPASCWTDWYSAVVEAWERLRARHSRVSVGGFSTGCLLGLHLAVMHPVESLVLMSPFLAIRRYWFYLLPPEVYLHSVGPFVREVPRRPLPIRDPVVRRAASKATWLRTLNLDAARSATRLISLVKRELPTVSTPALVIMSRRDTVVDPSGAVLLHERLGSPVKRLLWLDRSDHLVPLDVEREVVFREALAWFEGTRVADCPAPSSPPCGG